MARRRSLILGLAAVPVIALVAAGCGSDDSSHSAAVTPAKAGGRDAATVTVASTSLGDVLVDASGRTAYLFKQDTGTKSTCTGACATSWPPVRSTHPTAGRGADDALLGTTKRSDGKPQVTYHGHPLYLFTGDAMPGDTNGQGVNAFGAQWFAVSPAGNQVNGQSTTPTGNGY
jgi:predicted lipoprotein with Yx(FWY)xxD motif